MGLFKFFRRHGRRDKRRHDSRAGTKSTKSRSSGRQITGHGQSQGDRIRSKLLADTIGRAGQVDYKIPRIKQDRSNRSQQESGRSPSKGDYKGRGSTGLARKRATARKGEAPVRERTLLNASKKLERAVQHRKAASRRLAGGSNYRALNEVDAKHRLVPIKNKKSLGERKKRGEERAARRGVSPIPKVRKRLPGERSERSNRRETRSTSVHDSSATRRADERDNREKNCKERPNNSEKEVNRLKSGKGLKSREYIPWC